MGKKVIIALYGHANTGKTTTLRKLALQFLELPEVEEDIQIGFLVGKKKIVVSTAKDDKVNTFFCEELDAHILVTATRTKEPGEECAPRIIVDPKSIKEDNTGSDQEQVTTQEEEISKLIEPIAMQNEITTLRQFSLELLKSDVVKGDIQIAFHYKGKRILISTAGDTVDEVNESTKLFGMLDADILVTATRNIGGTRTCIRLRDNGEGIKSEAIWISKCGSESPNEVQAKKLRAFIDLIIDNWDN